MYDFSNWTRVTGDLPWGVQRAFLDSLQAVADHGTKMVYGMDYDSQNFPCLVNTAAPMLEVGGGHGIPSSKFRDVVSEFDRINGYFGALGVNEGNRVSPVAADFLVHHFGPLKPQPTAEQIAAAVFAKNPTLDPVYIEPTDDEFQQHLITMGTAPEVHDEPVDVNEAQRVTNPLRD